MKYLALCVLAIVGMAFAKPETIKIKISGRQKRDAPKAESIDFGSIDFGSFRSEFNVGLQSMLDSGKDIDSFIAGFDALASTLDKIGGNTARELQTTDFFGSQFASLMASNIPDPFTNPDAFASYASRLEKQVGEMGSAGSSLIDSVFDAKIEKGMDEFGLSKGFADGELEASEFFEQMDPQAWKTMSKLGEKKSLFKMDDMTSDDFFGLIGMASEAPDDFLEQFLAINEDSSVVTPEMIIDIPPEVFAAMDPTVLAQASSNFSAEQTDALCMSMEYTDAETAMSVFESVDCTTYFAESEKEMDPEYEAAMLDALRSSKSSDKWDAKEWDKMSRFAGGLEPDDFDRMPGASLLKNIGTFAGQIEAMGEDIIFSLLDNMETAVGGDFSKLSADNLKDMGDMLDYMEPEDFSMIPPRVMLESLESFGGLEFNDEFAEEMAEELFDIMPPLDRWTGSEFSKCIDILKYDEDSLDMIPMDAIADSMDKFADLIFDEDEAATLADRFMDDPVYGNPSNWNESTLELMGPVLSGFTPDFIERFPAGKLVTALASMNKTVRDKIQFNRACSRSILDKMVSSYGSFSDIPVNATGLLLKAATSAEISQIPGDIVKDVIGMLNDIYDDLDQSARRVIIEQFKKSTGGLSHFGVLGKFFKDLNLDEIDQLPFHLISPKSPPNPPISVQNTPAQARRAWQNVVNLIGHPSKASGNWSMKMWKGLGNVVCGIPCSEARKLPLGRKTASILRVFADIEKKTGGCLNDAQMHCVATRLKQFFFKNGKSQPKYATKANLKKAARFLPFFSSEELNMFGQSTCSYILSNVGSYKLTNVPRKQLIRIKNYLLNCTGKAASGEKITLKELRSVGDVACGIEVDDVANLEDKIFKNQFSKIIQRCDLPLDVIDAMFGKVLQLNDITNLSPNISASKLMKLGPAIINLDDALLAKIPNKVWMKILSRVKNAITEAEKRRAEREELGLGSDVSDSDKANKKSRKERFYAKAAQVVAAIRKAAASSRKKRSASSSLTCSDMKKMGSGITSLTTTQLDITDKEFKSCYEFLGKETGWSSAQKSQLATTATRVWGSASSWASSKVILSGTIAQGLSKSDLQSITYSNDIVSAIGKYSGWTSTQLSTVFNQYLSNTQSSKSSNLDSAELQSLGNFACGAETSQISSIPAASYKGASAQVGKITICSQSQLAAFATLAQSKSAYGAVSTWDTSTIAAVGTVMGGLDTSQVSTLTTTQIEGMSASTVANLPPSVFAGFTSSQLTFMSTTQRRSISNTQAAYLSPSAKSTLKSSGDFVTAPLDDPSGADSINSFMALQLASILMFLRGYVL